MSFRRLITAGLVAGLLGMVGFVSEVHAQGNAGVLVDSQGVLKRNMVNDPGGHLTRQRMAAARATFAGDIAKASDLRYVSLNRLEKVLSAQLDAKKPMSPDMVAMAGLTRVTHVFYLPESNDVVIAGPAEPWYETLDGNLLGLESQRPVIRLEDMVVALRAFPPSGGGARMIGCSIDPTKEGLARMQQFLANIGGRPPAASVIVNGLRTSLGMQKVSVMGVPSQTRFAQVLVAADYRMKLIGIGLEKPATRIPSYVSLARPSRSANAMVRWFFTPDYKCVRVAEDKHAMQLEGQGVKLIGADEVVGPNGQRQQLAGKKDLASQQFTKKFTEGYKELASKTPIFAELRNLIDLSIVAAFIQQNDLYGQASWNADLLMNKEQMQVEHRGAPKLVETTVNAVWKGSRLMTPVGGGVTMHPRTALNSSNLLDADSAKLTAMREEIKVEDLDPNQWWWD